ncbi:MAG TPA: hypothetical protein DCX89_05290 [Saprospirales bacterium]|nr:hypothetical protein [Saprospirales bacterium]
MKKNLRHVFSSSFFILITVLSFALLLHACKSKSTYKPESEASVEQVSYTQEELMIKGKEIAGQINASLQEALKKAIEEKGFEGAISFCSLKAIPITDSISQKENVLIQRVSHKARNPENQAGSEDMKIIERYLQISQDTLAKKQATMVAQHEKKIFYAPIYVANSLCLNCHGKPDKEILPSLGKAIAEKYPDDQATGFTMNDFRGLLKIEFKKKF